MVQANRLRSTEVNGELQNIQQLAAALRENLVRCAHHPGVDPVHNTRTGTRRLQATLESLVRETPQDEAGEMVREGAAAMMRHLKKIRRAAAPVRDLDVHRKLLQKLTKQALGVPVEKAKTGRAPHETQNAVPPLPPDRPDLRSPREAATIETPDFLERPEAGMRTTGVGLEADRLDAWLKRQRADRAAALRTQAPGLMAKLDKRLADVVTALRRLPRRRRASAPAALALDCFAQLATEMQLLDAANLHDFRKGAKKARYVAELAEQADTYAGQVGKALRKLQDEIGNWHDWLVLAEEAHAALGHEATELFGLVEAERERHFVAAMKTAAKLRGRLMGEWLAAAQRGRLRSGQQTSGQLRTGQR